MNPSIMKLINAEIKAEEIIKKLQIREPSEILIRDISMERGAFVKEDILEGSEARLIRRGGKGIITICNKIPEEGRKRFAIAHELGHFELHKTSQLNHCAEEDMYVWNENEIYEIEANKFAASILMPAHIFSQYLDKGQPKLKNIKKISAKFRTSLTATALRYISLSSEPCAIAVTKNDIIRWYKKSSSFEFHVKVGEKLSPFTEIHNSNEVEEIPKIPTKMPATAWISGIKDKGAMIYEQSLVLKRYDVLLSLIWIDDDIR